MTRLRRFAIISLLPALILTITVTMAGLFAFFLETQLVPWVSITGFLSSLWMVSVLIFLAATDERR
jgi:hypothetical protein